MSLYKHQPHAYVPRNVNALHEIEQRTGSFNQRLAVTITRATSTMLCAYVFAALALLGLCGILGWLPPVIILIVSWTSQTFLQLTFLPILSVGQATLNRKQELQANEQYQTTIKSYADVEQIVKHLEAQDAELQRQSALLEQLVQQQSGRV